MDYTISNNARLFDDLLAVLNRHQNEPSVVETIADLRAAKLNYTQRSMDHMMNCLVLAVNDLSRVPNQDVRQELSAVIQKYVREIFEAGSKIAELSRQYEASGGKLLSHEEILQEVDERRGGSH